MKNIRTDLALEVRESFTEDDVEIKGVILSEDYIKKAEMKVTTVEIKDSAGAKAMGKPEGIYITLEAKGLSVKDDSYHETVSNIISDYIKSLSNKAQRGDVLIAGLGNREITSDALGPMVVDNLFVTRHLYMEYKDGIKTGKDCRPLSAIAPGVMGQTGMEVMEILKGIIKETKPKLVLVIDALAARSTKRLAATIQITDTGICPGAGIGNNRQALNKNSLGVDVIALGVPTVVDAMTIVRDSMEQMLKRQEFTENEINAFFNEVTNDSEFTTMFVTPKNIDESVKCISYTISEAINNCFS